jgi:hypothetical protein
MLVENDAQEHSSFMPGEYRRENHSRELLSQLQGTEFIFFFDSNSIETIKNNLGEREPSKENIRKTRYRNARDYISFSFEI